MVEITPARLFTTPPQISTIAAPTVTAIPTDDDGGSSTGAIVGVVVGLLVFTIVLIIVSIGIYK